MISGLIIILVSFRSCYGSDSRCTGINGICQENSHSCSGSYHTGLCDGHASRQCCTSSQASSSSGSHHYATGLVSQNCLQCICNLLRWCVMPAEVAHSPGTLSYLISGQHESRCQPLGCAWDENSNSCGYFQLKEVYWTDCGKPGGSLDACSRDIHCASQCVQRYMSRYIAFSGCAHNCESYARIHNGGPKGCKHSNTLRYWSDVQREGCSVNS